MKKTLLLLALASLSLSNLFAIVIYQPYGDTLINSGSALCENLSFEYKLPDSLKTGYDVTVSFDKNVANRTLIVSYSFIEKEDASLSSSIVSDLNDLFSPINEPFNANQASWKQIIQIIVVNNFKEIELFFSPYQKCYEITKKCEEVRYTEKQIRYATDCGSSSGIILTKRINSDSLIIDSENVTVPAVCVQKNFGIDSTVVVFSDLENKNYSLYKTEKYLIGMTYITHYNVVDGIITNDPLTSLPIPGLTEYSFKKFLGKADLSDCLVNGMENSFNRSNKIYPNPITNYFNISDFKGDVTLTNQIGTRFQLSGNERFEVSNLPKGIYIATFEFEDSLYQEKIIIE